MKVKFYGSFPDLKKRVSKCGVGGFWHYIARSNLHQFKAETGENLNWWPSTGTVTFQGGDIPILQDRYLNRYLPHEFRRSSDAGAKRSARTQAVLSRGGPRRSVNHPKQAPRRPKRGVD